MDDDMESPLVLNSFHCNEQLSTRIVELNRKRKLQYELGDSGLPWPKHKFRDRFSSSGPGSLISETPENKANVLKELTGRKIGDGLEQPEELDNDSNSSSGVCDNSMTLDGKTGKSSSQAFHQDQSSTSSNSSNNNDFEETLYSLGNRSIKEANNGEPADLDETLQFEPRHKAIEDQYPGFGAYGDYIVSEVEKSCIELADTATEDMMLYSNDVAPNAYLLSSGRWSLGQDARLGSRKPTIDQEFEQYFSMLML